MVEIPKVSLVTLAGRDRCNLNRLIDSIRQLSEYPFEIIVVVDVKHHGVPAAIELEGDCKVKVLAFHGAFRQPQMRNLGLQHSEGDYIWFIDDDVSLGRDSVSNLKKVINEVNGNALVGAIGGRIIEECSFDINKLNRPIFFSPLKGAVGYFNYADNVFPIEKYECLNGVSGKKYAIIPFVQGTSMVFRKSYLEYIGGFDEELGVGYASFEDSEPCFALKRHGWLTIYCGEFELVHHKLIRIGGGGRGYDDYKYSRFLVRNHTIALMRNGYPSWIKAALYIFAYALVHPLRMTYHKSGQSITYRSPLIFISSVYYVFLGVIMGFLVLAKSRLTRVNTSRLI